MWGVVAWETIEFIRITQLIYFCFNLGALGYLYFKNLIKRSVIRRNFNCDSKTSSLTGLLNQIQKNELLDNSYCIMVRIIILYHKVTDAFKC